jgi:hypothetical protein
MLPEGDERARVERVDGRGTLAHYLRDLFRAEADEKPQDQDFSLGPGQLLEGPLQVQVFSQAGGVTVLGRGERFVVLGRRRALTEEAAAELERDGEAAAGGAEDLSLMGSDGVAGDTVEPGEERAALVAIGVYGVYSSDEDGGGQVFGGLVIEDAGADIAIDRWVVGRVDLRPCVARPGPCFFYKVVFPPAFCASGTRSYDLIPHTAGAPPRRFFKPPRCSVYIIAPWAPVSSASLT